MADDKLLIGKKFKEIRAKSKLTQELFSEMIGLEPSSLSNIETGKSFPSMQTLLNVMNKFNIKPEEFFDNQYFKKEPDLEKDIIETVKNLPYERKQILFRIIKALEV